MTPIRTFEQFQEYLESKGYIPYVVSEVPGEGFFCELKTGEAKPEHFTKIGLPLASVKAPSHTKLTARYFPEKFEWSFLAYPSN